MQKSYSIIFIAVAVVIIYFGTKALSGPQDEKIAAFNSSINDESKGNYNEAINRLMKIYDKNKDNYLINLRLGWLNYLKGSQEQSKKYYRSAVSITKQKSIEPYLGLTYPLAALEEWDELKSTYEKVLELDPNNYTAQLRLGQIYLTNGDYQNAKNHLVKAHTSFQGVSEVNMSLGWTYYYLGDKDRANELFISALMLNSKDSLANEGYNLTR